MGVEGEGALREVDDLFRMRYSSTRPYLRGKVAVVTGTSFGGGRGVALVPGADPNVVGKAGRILKMREWGGRRR